MPSKFPEHHGSATSAGGGGGSSGVNWDGLAGIVAGLGVIVLAINLWLWAWPYVRDAAICVGMVVIGYAVVRGYLFYRKAKARYYAAMPGAERPQVQYVQQPMVQPRQQQALPAAQVHHHHGHTLALPGDWTPEQIRAFKGEQ